LTIDKPRKIWYNIDTKGREVHKMKTYTVEHRHCKAIRTIEGYDIWDAMRKNNLDTRVWREV
jgi:hypothetical protein